MIGHQWENFIEARKTMDGKASLDALGLSRVCCRRMLLTHVPIIDDTVLYSNADRILDECSTVWLAHIKHDRVVKCD
tara:strand:- start:1839 stop:2069 length:231 start_codon:yes stop_codon:yes gene_type:complete